MFGYRDNLLNSSPHIRDTLVASLSDLSLVNASKPVIDDEVFKLTCSGGLQFSHVVHFELKLYWSFLMSLALTLDGFRDMTGMMYQPM